MFSFITAIIKSELTKFHNITGWIISLGVMTGITDKLVQFNGLIESFTTVVISLASLVFVVVRIYYTIKNKGK